MDEIDMIFYIWFYLGLFCVIGLIAGILTYLTELWRLGHEEFVLFWSCSVALIVMVTIIII